MARPVLFVLIALMMAGCRESDKREQPSENQDPKGVTFYLGTYTQDNSRGIYKYQLSADGSLKESGLVAESDNPSFLATSSDGQYLLAVNEVSNAEQMGYVSLYRIERDSLEFMDQKPSGGAHPCHVVVNRDGFIVVANYSGGNMGLLRIKDDGRLSDLLDVQQHQGEGEHPRQEGPHAHSGWFTDKGQVISVDLGTNQLWFSEIDQEGLKFVPSSPPTLDMEPGAGPRHLTFHPTEPWIYVLNELSSSVSLLIKDPESEQYEISQNLTTLPNDFDGQNTCADIHLSPDGKFLYASNRGHDSIAIYSIDPQTGKLTVLGHEATRGETPRNFSLSPDGNFLLVANQNTDNIVSFRRDSEAGLLTFLDEIEAPTPVCIVFVP